MGQTVNLLAFAFGGSNPSLPTTRGCTKASDEFTDSEVQPLSFVFAGAASPPVVRYAGVKVCAAARPTPATVTVPALRHKNNPQR